MFYPKKDCLWNKTDNKDSTDVLRKNDFKENVAKPNHFNRMKQKTNINLSINQSIYLSIYLS